MSIDAVYKSMDNVDNNVSPAIDNRFNLGTTGRRWGVLNCVTVNTTDLDLTTIEVTNIDAKDGTAVMTLTDTTGAVDANARDFTNFGLVDTTNLEATNIKAKDGTACIAIADTTGIPTFTPAIKLTSDIDVYNNVTTTGWGVPAIYSSGRSTAQNAAVASVATYTVGAADGSFEVSANVLVTTATDHSFTVTCAYTDEGNTARTLTMAFLLVAGSAITNTIANAAGAVPYMGLPVHIRAKAATAITIATTGTFTTVVYNVEGSIKQIA